MAEGPPSGNARTAGGPNIGAIRSGMSFPRDPDAPSFLTTLPAELRLQIYEYLFLRDKPVIVKPRPSWFHNTRFMDRDHIWPDSGSEEDEVDAWPEVLSMTQNCEDSLESSERLSETPSDIHSGFGLLGACRQIYTEAIATLYSKNTFILSVTRREFLSRRIDITVQWMRTLGSTINILRHVHIRSIRSDYTEDCLLCPIDITRLARFMWQNSTTELHISFGPRPKALRDPLAGLHWCKYSELMSNAFTAFVKNDPLDLQRYAVSERLVSKILIENRVISGSICHPYSTGPDNDHRYISDDGADDEIVSFGCKGIYKNFKVSNKGRHISWKEPPIWPTYSNMPVIFYHLVPKYVIFSEHGTSFDLDRKTSSGFQAKVLGICSLLRTLALYKWSSINTITLKMTTDQIHTNFSNFAALRHWIETPFSNVLKQGQYQPNKEHRIVLQFRLDSPSTLSMLRIKLLRLLQLTLHMDRRIKVLFALGYSTHGEENIESHTTTLEQLRHNLSFVLRRVCDMHSQTWAWIVQM